MYRSPGTSSSPDLATLLRKAKERSGAMIGGGSGGQRREREREARERERELRERHMKERDAGATVKARHHLRAEENMPRFDQATLRQGSQNAFSSTTLVASPVSGRTDEHGTSPEWVMPSPQRQKESQTQTLKVSYYFVDGAAICNCLYMHILCDMDI
jgi:hypothetical protein